MFCLSNSTYTPTFHAFLHMFSQTAWGLKRYKNVSEDIQEILQSRSTVFPSSKKGKRKVQGVPQSQAAALSGHQEEEETDKTKQAQIEQTN